MGMQSAVPRILINGEVVLMCMVDFGSAKSNRSVVWFYVFIWCFQDERAPIVLPDCLGGVMLSLRPENLQPLTKGTLFVIDTVPCSQALSPFSKKMQRPIQILTQSADQSSSNSAGCRSRS